MQHQGMEAHDRFFEACDNFGQYIISQPENREPLEILEAQQLWGRFKDEKKSVLFKNTNEKIDVWETGRRNKFPDSGDMRSLSRLSAIQQYFKRSDKNPHIRHVFVEPNDSRSPLNCSLEMFRFICTFQQTEPFFLETVAAFGQQAYPTDYCLAQFRSKMPETGSRTSLSLPRLGRSGRQVHLSYLLRSVEHSGKEGIEGWQIRQAANYHSFDIETGRSFWFTVKANNIIKNRIKEFTPHLQIPSKEDVTEGNISSYLKAALATHLLYLAWSDEGWRDFINDFETSIRTIVGPAKTALVDDHIDPNSSQFEVWPGALQGKRRQRTMSYRLSRGNTGITSNHSNKVAPTSVKDRMVSFGRDLFGRLKETKPDEEQGVSSPAVQYNHSSGLDPSGSLDKLRVKDIQTLYSRSELMQRALLVLELNIGVLHDIHAYYSRLKSVEFSQQKYDGLFDNFLAQVVSITRRLETRQAQLNSLSKTLSQCIQLYELVLQQRSNQIGMDFADVAHESTKQMNMVADKTSRQTASMHVITVVTLIFLPATFVATFFQSGVLLRDDQTGDFSFRGKSFRLFSAVCGPLTTVTMGVWFIVFVRLKWKARREAEAGRKQRLGILGIASEAVT